jgi:hypothetical protein
MAPERKSDIAQGTSGSGSLNLSISVFSKLLLFSLSTVHYTALSCIFPVFLSLHIINVKNFYVEGCLAFIYNIIETGQCTAKN